MCGLFPSVGSTAPSLGLAFLCAVVAWAGVSTMIFQHYERMESRRPVLFWRRTLTAVWCVHAVIWGSMLFVFWDEGNTVNQAILCTIVLGVVVSYFFMLTMSLPVLLPTLGTMIAVATIAFVSHGDTLSQVFLFMYPLFSLILVNYGLKAARSYHAALQLRFENEALAAALSRASKAKSTFLASMSHELRTPLNAIIGYSDLMLQRTFGPIAPARYGTYVQDIHDSGSHLLHMINDLLDLAKIEAGKHALVFEPVRLHDIAAEALRLVDPQAKRGHVSVSVNLPIDVVVNADERALKQILVNLLSNAVKFTSPGGSAVVYCQRSQDGHLSLGVKDTGAGMSPEMQARAMQPFEQGGDAYTVEGRGTGLGLSICKSLAEAHHGALKLESTPGIGSRVWVDLPAERVLRVADAA
jgi:signal transduction histidine kinase